MCMWYKEVIYFLAHKHVLFPYIYIKRCRQKKEKGAKVKQKGKK